MESSFPLDEPDDVSVAHLSLPGLTEPFGQDQQRQQREEQYWSQEWLGQDAVLLIQMFSLVSSLLFGDETAKNGNQSGTDALRLRRRRQTPQNRQLPTVEDAVAVDPYKVLQVRRDATHSEIQHAYRR